MEELSVESFETWNTWAQYIAMAFAALAGLIVLGHIIRLGGTRDAKKKYDYINRSEINTLLAAGVVLIIGGAFYFNSNIVELTILMVFVRVFVTIMMGLIMGVIIHNLLKFYYPFYIERRLRTLRFKPRISPKTGKPMKLLSEDEEDVYLDEGMQAEEEIYSVDYDVWVDEETGYTKIEKYAGHLHALQCPECNYQTFKVNREEIVRQPTVADEGELIKHFECQYCGYKARKSYHIATLKSAEAGAEKSTPATA
jgi:DNA-directed RNA polymerase subunit RPC12/RpoP